MKNIKDQFIKAIMQSLKIDNNPFIFATVDEYIAHLKPVEYKSFMKELFGTQHQYLNGLDRVAKVAEQFKPHTIDPCEDQAKQVINLVRSMNEAVFNNAKATGRTFDAELKITAFPTVSNEDIAILNNVKPYYEYKSLVTNINHYSTAKECLEAFKMAISRKDNIALSNQVTQRLKIAR